MKNSMSDPPQPASSSKTVATPLYPRRRGIIIGASDGIGAALARCLAREGYTLALLARRQELLETLCRDINLTANEQRARAYSHDVTDYDKVPNLLRRIVADLGGLDLVVFVAGINYPPGGIDKYNFENDRRMVETNLIGAMAWLSPVASMSSRQRRGKLLGLPRLPAIAAALATRVTIRP